MQLLASEISHYSSDWNCDSLICTTSDGSITKPLQSDSAFMPDHLKKHIRFYPQDCAVFTTTDTRGLRVWDASRNALLYSYRRDSLGKHCYSPNCLVTAFNDYNINFYDLRCRYVTNSMKASGLVDVGWAGRLLCVYDRSTVKVYDQGLGAPLQTFESIAAFTIGGDTCFMIRRDGSQSSLVTLSETSVSTIHAEEDPVMKPGNLSVLSKSTNYQKIFGLRNERAIAGIAHGSLKIEGFERIIDIPLQEKLNTVNAVLQAGDGLYIFADDHLFFTNRSSAIMNRD